MYKKEAMIDIRKIPVAAAVLIICALLSGCRQEQTEPERTSSDYVYHSSVTLTETQPEEESATAQETTSSEETTDTAATAAAPAVTQLVTVPVPATTASPVQQPTQTPPTTAPVKPSAAPETKETTAAAYDPASEVDLSIVMPEANGKMEVDSSPDNRFVQKVSDTKGIAAERLAAVYSVPDNGQNYVFEFTSESSRTVNDLRRVFLVDSDGNIQSVAASDSSLKVNLSPTENWFCMNVLIKGVIFPAIKDQF